MSREDTDMRNAASDGDVSAMQKLMARGCSVNAQNRYGLRPLHNAASEGRAEAVEFLIKNGAEVKVNTKSGDSPLHEACKNGHAEVIEILVRSGADLEERNNDGMTALHNCVVASHPLAVKKLLEIGADRQARVNFDGKSCVELANSDDIRTLFKEIAVTSPTPQAQPQQQQEPKAVSSPPMEPPKASIEPPQSSLPQEAPATAKDSPAVERQQRINDSPAPQRMATTAPPPQMPALAQPVTITASSDIAAMLQAQTNEIRALRQEVFELRNIVANLTVVPRTVSVEFGGKTITYQCHSSSQNIL